MEIAVGAREYLPVMVPLSSVDFPATIAMLLNEAMIRTGAVDNGVGAARTTVTRMPNVPAR